MFRIPVKETKKGSFKIKVIGVVCAFEELTTQISMQYLLHLIP